jgi:hypothetical protein
MSQMWVDAAVSAAMRDAVGVSSAVAENYLLPLTMILPVSCFHVISLILVVRANFSSVFLEVSTSYLLSTPSIIIISDVESLCALSRILLTQKAQGCGETGIRGAGECR